MVNTHVLKVLDKRNIHYKYEHYLGKLKKSEAKMKTEGHGET